MCGERFVSGCPWAPLGLLVSLVSLVSLRVLGVPVCGGVVEVVLPLRWVAPMPPPVRVPLLGE